MVVTPTANRDPSQLTDAQLRGRIIREWSRCREYRELGEDDTARVVADRVDALLDEYARRCP